MRQGYLAHEMKLLVRVAAGKANAVSARRMCRHGAAPATDVTGANWVHTQRLR